MAIHRPRRDFHLFQRKDGKFYFVRFKDKETGKITKTKSTKKTTYREAEAVAYAWLNTKIPDRKGDRTPEFQSVLSYISRLTDSEKKILAEALRKKDVYAAVVEYGGEQAIDFVEYLTTFWDWKKSPYVKRKNGEKPNSIHRRYCESQKDITIQHWKPFFQGKLLGQITKKMINDFREHLNEVRLKNGNPLSGGWKNRIMSAGCRPLKNAFAKELIETDPTAGLKRFPNDSNETEILTPEMAGMLFTVTWEDERAKIANYLALSTGMRSGEIQALQVQDLGDDRLYVRHSYNVVDRLKTTKTGKERVVYVLPGMVSMLSALASKNPYGCGPESYIFFAMNKRNQPCDGDVFLLGMRRALKQLGMAEKETMKYKFHAWRHFHFTHMRKRLSPRLLKSQAGWETDDMVNRYTDHDLAGDEQEIRDAQAEFLRETMPQLLLPATN